MDDLKVALVQSFIEWENRDANLTWFEGLIKNVERDTDIILLPEMFTSGFSMGAERLAEEMTGVSVAWMKKMASLKGAHVAGSVMIREGGQFYNRLIWATPCGDLFTYDKRHLFRYAGEDRVYTPGKTHLTVTVKGWHVRPFICYDLRFPVWTRNMDNRYDVAVFIASWPGVRAYHWKTLLAARAIENQAYVIGVNRSGMDGHGVSYGGGSAVLDPLGAFLLQMEQESNVCHVRLSLHRLRTCRADFPVWMDADGEMVVWK